jgi:hypothetical protein
MLHQEFHGVETALRSFMERLLKGPTLIHFRAVLQNHPHGRDVVHPVPGGIPVQRPTSNVITKIGVSVEVQEQLDHLGRPRTMHVTEFVTVSLEVHIGLWRVANEPRVNGTLSKSAAMSKRGRFKFRFCPDFVAVEARDVKDWKTGFNVCA